MNRIMKTFRLQVYYFNILEDMSKKYNISQSNLICLSLDFLHKYLNNPDLIDEDTLKTLFLYFGK